MRTLVLEVLFSWTRHHRNNTLIAICTLQENNKIQKGQKSRFNPAGLNGVQSKELDWKYIRQVSSDALAAHLCRGDKDINSLQHTTSVNQVLRVMGLDSHDRPSSGSRTFLSFSCLSMANQEAVGRSAALLLRIKGLSLQKRPLFLLFAQVRRTTAILDVTMLCAVEGAQCKTRELP